MKYKHLTKTCLALLFVSFFTSSLQAQYFEWAKGYSSSQEGEGSTSGASDSGAEKRP